MMNDLTKNELIAIRDSVLALTRVSQLRKATLIGEGIITPDEADQISRLEESLSKVARDLNDAILQVISADLENPGNRIIAVTNNVQNAISRLQVLNDFIGILSSVLTMLTTVVTSFATGNPLQLVSLLDQIEALL